MTDMNLNIDTTTATAAPSPVVSPAARMLLAAKLVNTTIGKIAALDDALADQRIVVQVAKEDVTTALTTGKDFDAASKAFKVSNTKLDKMLESRETLVSNAQKDLDAVRDTLAEVSAQLRSLDA